MDSVYLRDSPDVKHKYAFPFGAPIFIRQMFTTYATKSTTGRDPCPVIVEMFIQNNTIKYQSIYDTLADKESCSPDQDQLSLIHIVCSD